MKKLWRIVSIVAAIGLMLPLHPPGAQAAEQMTVMLDWAFGGKHVPYFLAIEKGWYPEKGMTLKLERGYGAGKSILAVDQGLAKFCQEDTISAILARSQGSTIKLLGMMAEKSPSGFIVLKGKPLARPQDLEGTKVGMPPVTTTRQFLPVFAKINKLNTSRIQIIHLDPAVQVPALLKGDVDVINAWAGANLAPFRIAVRKQGKDLTFLSMADWGLDVYSLGLMTREQTIRETPDWVRNFVQATYRAWITA